MTTVCVAPLRAQTRLGSPAPAPSSSIVLPVMKVSLRPSMYVDVVRPAFQR